jgi:hypothetical protein
MNSPLPSTPDNSVTILPAVQDSAVVTTKACSRKYWTISFAMGMS